MNTNNNDFKIKKNSTVIDAVNYNGKYVDVEIIKRRVISAIAIIGAAAFAGVIIFL